MIIFKLALTLILGLSVYAKGWRAVTTYGSPRAIRLMTAGGALLDLGMIVWAWCL